MSDTVKGIVIGAVGGAGGIVLAAFVIYWARRLLLRQGPALSADVVAVPFDAPWPLLMGPLDTFMEQLLEVVPTLVADSTGVFSERLKQAIEGLAKGRSKMADAASDARYKFGRLTDALYFTVSNRGVQPAEEVFLRIPEALLYRDWKSGNVHSVDPGDPVIRLGKLDQGHEIKVAVWTQHSGIKYGWNWLTKITLGHQGGVGIVYGKKIGGSRLLSRWRVFATKHPFISGCLDAAAAAAVGGAVILYVTRLMDILSKAPSQ